MRKAAPVLALLVVILAVPAAYAQNGHCTQLFFTEYLDASGYSGHLTIGGQQPANFVELTSAVLPVDDAYHGNNTIGHETLRFVFTDGYFDLDARYTVQGDMFSFANVNGAGTVTGYGAYEGFTGHLMYHGGFIVSPVDFNFSFLDLFYAGNVCATK